MATFPDHASTTTLPAPDDGIVTHEAWKALFGSAIGYAMDGFDLLILGFMLRIISADLGWRRPRVRRW